MKTSSRLLIILAAIILYTTGVLTSVSVANKRDRLAQIDKSPVSAPEQNQSLSVMVDTGEDLIGFPNIALKDGDTVWSVLEKVSAGRAELPVEGEQYQDMGMLVKSIKGFVNGTDGQYWQYWLNNKYADASADKQAVKAGDVILWKFTKAQFKEY